MRTFREFLTEKAQHTDIADINEILFGYYCGGADWSKYEDSKYVRGQYDRKIKKLTQEELNIQDDRAERMAKETLKWAATNGYGGRVSKVWWTARPGSLQKAVGNSRNVSDKNPADNLLLFTTGEFLGLSAKSTSGLKDIGFKNLGVGTIDKLLSLDLTSIVKEEEKKFIEEHNLPSSAKVRKAEIRRDPEISSAANKERTAIMNKIREVLLRKLNKLSDDEARSHIVENWMDSGSDTYPPYIKVTGTRNGVLIEDPLKNSKIEALNKGDIKFSPLGNETIGVVASGKKIMKMRFKYTSQALASSMKMSGDPW